MLSEMTSISCSTLTEVESTSLSHNYSQTKKTRALRRLMGFGHCLPYGLALEDVSITYAHEGF